MTTFKFVLFESQILFIVRKLLCRNGLFLKVFEELQNIPVFRMESISLLHNWISSCNFDHDLDTYFVKKNVIYLNLDV